MNKQELLQLQKLATLTPNGIQKQDTALFGKLSAVASLAFKTQVEEKLKDAPTEIKEGLKAVDFAALKLGTPDVKSTLSKAVLAGKVSAAKKKELETAVSKMPELGSMDNVLQADVPILLNPLFQKDLQKARLYRLNAITGITDAKTEKISSTEIDVDNLENEQLELLVKTKTITRAEADKLELALGLYQLADGNFELATEISKQAKPTALSDLVGVDKAGWKKWIENAGIDLSEGITADDYADFMAKKVAHLYPEASLHQQTVRITSAELQKNIKLLDPLTKKNPTLFGVHTFDELNTDGLTAARRKSIKEGYEQINKLVRANPGLRLSDVLNDRAIKTTDKGNIIDDRIALVDRFRKQNEEVHYLSLEYKHDSDDLKLLNLTGFSDYERAMVLDNVKAQQRIFSFTQDVMDTQQILAAGYHAAFHITAVTLDEFINTTKFDRATAIRYYEQAHMAFIRTTGVMGSILDLLTGSFNWTNVGNLGTPIKEYLRDIPGYQDLFGELAFCDCSDCQSIYSPAAYFVDLMQFVDRYVITKHFAGINGSHVLNIKTRRPDLWSLELSCENTTALVPYLDIINEILEAYIAKQQGYTGNLNDRAAVETWVYKNKMALEGGHAWKNEVYAFQQPFHLPLEAVQTYLGHFEKTREDIGRLLQRPPSEIAQARFNLSDKVYQLITSVDATPTFIKRVYGLSFTLAGGKISPFNAQDLLKPTGLSRKELGVVLKTRYVTGAGADDITIQSEKKNADSIQNDIERIQNLTYASLDRLHRFIRLWRKTGVTIAELDGLIGMAKDMGVGADLTPGVITALGQWLRIKAELDLTVDELSGTIHLLPAPYFDRLFNHQDVVMEDGTYPKPSIKLIHPALAIDQSSTGAVFSAFRLSVALNRSDDEVLTLIRYLARPLGITALNAPTESGRGFLLTAGNLSLLYRHSTLAKSLKIKLDDFFELMALSSDFPAGYLENANQVDALLVLHQWWKTSGYTLDDLHFILKTGKAVNASSYLSSADTAREILQEITEGNQLIFADTVFAYVDGITEAQSREIIAANPLIIEQSPDGANYRLKVGFDPANALAVPAGITVAESDLRNVLAPYHAAHLIPFHLSSRLSLAESTLRAIITATGFDLNQDALTQELLNNTEPSLVLKGLIDHILPLSVLFKGKKKFTADAISFIVANPALFGITDMESLTLQNIRQIHSYASFIKVEEDGSSQTANLNAVILAFSATNQFQLADQGLLASLLATTEELLTGIHPLAGAFTDAIAALAFYRECTAVCGYIGIGGGTLAKIVSTNYDILNAAMLEILGAFRSKYPDEAERKGKLEDYQNTLRGKKRSALTTYLIHSGFPQFENTDDLYHYFLIDTELEGCSRTSRLVAATMSLQLYIHRILLNLEQDAYEPGTAGRVHVRPNDIPADEWEWRRNYRVWEANRKVFLYPENYIEPDLRDDKTPLFKELESNLLQNEINADNVLDAYGRYMRGFDEVAHLKIAGSYHEKDDRSATDVLHLFGVTADEPAVYYYRRVENLYYAEKQDDRGVVWEPWQKLNVQIPVRKVTPITYNGRLHVFWTRITTLGNTVFDNNRSIFTGYSHKVSIEFTTLKLDGTWTPPQKLDLRDCYPFEGNGVIQDPLADRYELDDFTGSLHDLLRSFPFFDLSSLTTAMRNLKTPRYALSPHYEPVDEYTLKGFLWDQVYPSVDSSGRLVLTGAGFQMRARIDFYNLNVQSSGIQVSGFSNDPVRESWSFSSIKTTKLITRSGNLLYRASAPSTQLFDTYAYGSLITNTTKSDTLLNRLWHPYTLNYSFDNIRQNAVATLRSGSQVQIVNGAFSDAIIDANGDLLLLQGTPVEGNGFLLKRIGTTLSETLTRTLFTSGVDTALNIATQKALKELDAPITLPTGSGVVNKVVNDKIDWKGAYGTYYREIFMHIPFLLANHLNSQGKFADAQKWYHYIFNPGSTEVVTYPAGATAAQKRKMELDRNWQYLEFRDIDVQTFRDQLNDKAAIETYKKDPFNPHAIARLRMSAYQKSIVMKYIDNLLDWGDQLFTQDTMESVNEATLLYVMAKEILGDRPAQIGDCGEGKVSPKNYATIQPLLNKGSEFLAELESYTIVRTPSKSIGKGAKKTKGRAAFESAKREVLTHYADSKSASMKGMSHGMSASGYKDLQKFREELLPEAAMEPVDDAFTGAFAKGVNKTLDWKKDSFYVNGKFRLSSFGFSIIGHVSPVFCVPGNKDLLAYYDRVDDRLFKIRNCMNILGQQRQLALFAPEIDPRLLVRAKAAGLSLTDVLNATAGNLPPYRFTYILDRAKAFTSVVQGFGSSLLGAMERRSGEELSLLRATQQQNILELSTKSRELEIKTAEEGINVLNSRLEALDYQIGYYEGLIAERTSGWEIAQQVGVHTSSILNGVAIPLWNLNGVFGLIPQIGSPFAMKYGGQELSESVKGFAEGIRSTALLADKLAASSGLEAGFDRRSAGWKHQKKLLENEKTQTEKNLVAAEIKRDILIEARQIHQKQIEHNQEVMDYYGEKFSNLGLHTWLSTTMQRVYKEAYSNALAIARLAEQAYRYERDDNTFFIGASYFESAKGGLLAGEQLLMSLHAMERRYLETNYRKNEIDQAFSLTQIDPAAMLTLKQTGTCTFNVPEMYFDLFYPGQYRRKIQSVRLTIPCVTGPYTNVGATLSLTSSQVRMDAKLGNAELKEVPKSRTTVIATSTAQNDAGVFQLNFKDDRYMPFEGAGAVSSWKLALPKTFRQFDYQTINDVIIHISYTAAYDELFRDKVEEQNDAIEGTLTHLLKNNPMERIISLRQEFSTDFHRLTAQQVGTEVLLRIAEKHFPLFLNGKPFKVTKSKLILVTPEGQTAAGVSISLNGTNQTGFTRDAAFGNLYAKDLGNLLSTGVIKDHTFRVTASGDFAPTAPPAGPVAAFDTDKLLDLVLYIEYQLA